MGGVRVRVVHGLLHLGGDLVLDLLERLGEGEG